MLSDLGAGSPQDVVKPMLIPNVSYHWLRTLLITIIIALFIIDSSHGYISTPFEDIRSKTILGGLINPQGYCHVTTDGVFWDDEEMCVLIQDIWGNHLFKCCKEYTWLSSSEKDCPTSNTALRYTSEILSDGTDSGPKRLNKNRYVPVIRGVQISMNSDGSFTTRDERNIYEGVNIGLGSCTKINKPKVKLQCDTGYVREKPVIINTKKIASLRKGDSFVKKLSMSTTKSVKTTQTTSLSTTFSMSNEQSIMLGVKAEVGEMSSNIKTVMSSSTTVSKTIGSEASFSKTEIEEQTFTINCGYENCHILVVLSQDCSYQEISKCSFIDPLPEFRDVQPGIGKLYYCEMNERLINSENPDPIVSMSDVNKRQVKGSISDHLGMNNNNHIALR